MAHMTSEIYNDKSIQVRSNDMFNNEQYLILSKIFLTTNNI